MSFRVIPWSQTIIAIKTHSPTPVCVFSCFCKCVCGGMYMEARHQLQVLILKCCPSWYFFFLKQSLELVPGPQHLLMSSRLDWLANESQGPTCLHLPSSLITRAHHHTRLVLRCGFWGTDLKSHVVRASALWTEHLPGSQVSEFRENADIQGNRFLCVLSSASKALPRRTSDVGDNCVGESKAGDGSLATGVSKSLARREGREWRRNY